MTDFKLNDVVSTPNGPGLFQAHTWANQAEAHIDAIPDAILIRHPKKAEIDLDKCAAVWSKSGADGWLVVYRVDEVKP